MHFIHSHTAFYISIFIILLFGTANKAAAQSRYGPNDTIVTTAVLYEGDTIEAKTLAGVYLWTKSNLTAKQRWTRLRNAVYVTYPYAKRAGMVFNDIQKHIVDNPDKHYINNYINSKEKELKKEFTDPLTNLSVYQGKVLMKLINRQTGNNCYEIIDDYKGRFSAGFWQTIALIFGSNLRQPYDPNGDDHDMESIVQDVERMYGVRRS